MSAWSRVSAPQLARVSAEAATPTQVPDADGDGIPDGEDDYPNNPDAFDRQDRDGDGVNNASDYAPDDPAVQDAPDTDGDGVTDDRDDLPDDPNRTQQLYYPSGDPVVEGYPVLVETAQLDDRLASWIDTPQAVAVAPGVFASYSPAQPDLEAYLDLPNAGDCAVRELYFPETGGACWSGVLPGPQEPPL